MADFTILSELWGFWKARWAKASVLVLCSSVILSLLVLTIAVRTVLVELPPHGTRPTGTWVTVGAELPGGMFGKVSLDDLRQLDSGGYAARWIGIATTEADVTLGAEPVRGTAVAAVTDTFFHDLGIQMVAGRGISEGHAGAVISWRFCKTHFQTADQALGASLSMDGEVLPIIGVLSPEFIGLADGPSDVYIPVADLFSAVAIELPIPPAQAKTAALQLVQKLPLYFGMVRLKDISELTDLEKRWSVRDNEYLSIDLPSVADAPRLQMKLGFSALGNKPQIVRGIDLDPSRSALVAKFANIISAIGLFAFILLCVDLAAYWADIAISRVHEYRIRVCVGATSTSVLWLCLRECAPFVLAVALGTMILLNIELYFLVGLEPFASALQATKGSLGQQAVAPAIAAVALILVIGLCFPLACIFNSLRVGQGVGASRTARAGQFIVRVVTWGGLVVTAYIVAVCVGYAIHLSHIPWGGDGDPLIFRSVPAEAVESIKSALSADRRHVAFVRTVPLETLQSRYSYFITYAGHSRHMSLAANAVSPAFLRVAGIDLVAGQALERVAQSRVMLSKSVARQLGVQAQSLVGAKLTRKVDETGKNDKVYVVGGVVEDVKYASLTGPAPMMVYTLMPPNPRVSNILVSGRYKEYLRAAIRSVDNSKSVASVLHSAQPISRVLAAKISSERRILLAIGVLGIALIVTILFALWSDITVLFRQMAGEVALRISLGARLWIGIFDVMQPLLAAVVCGTGLAALVAVPTAELLNVGGSGGVWTAWAIVFALIGGALLGVCVYFYMGILSRSLLTHLRR